jgi:hypothetical protein
MLKNILKNEMLFDIKNPAIILCSKKLEHALDMKALHVSEIRELVSKQLILIKQKTVVEPKINQSDRVLRSSIVKTKPQIIQRGRVLRSSKLIDQSTNILSPNIFNNKNAKFLLKPDFKKVLAQLENFPKKKKYFLYDDVCSFLSQYILVKKEQLFDCRNIKIALVKNDALGKVFCVDAFHRCQVTSLLRKQLIYATGHYV